MVTYSHIISAIQESMIALLDEVVPTDFLVERLIELSGCQESQP